MVCMAKVMQCRLVAVVLAVAAITVTGAACCCWSPVTSLSDVIILLAAGRSILLPEFNLCKKLAITQKQKLHNLVRHMAIQNAAC